MPLGVANSGQLKYIAYCAIRALKDSNPALGAQVEVQLVGVGKPIPTWDKAVSNIQPLAPVNIGQLKAVAAPFYSILHSAYPPWVESQLITNGTKSVTAPWSAYPWSTQIADDQNNALATVGQLKSVFALRFEQIVDADSDGMMDSWEATYGFDSGSNADAAMDHDGDGITNLEEYRHGTDPNNTDTDGDSMPDVWEVTYALNPLDTTDLWHDPDGDQLANVGEFQYGSNPRNPDTDGDGIFDGWEVTHGLDPVSPLDGAFDNDGDGLSNLVEYQIGTNPANADTDSDGMPDEWEFYQGTYPSTTDGNFDYDQDGWDNLYEFQHGTGPWDYDNDGLVDSWEINSFGNLAKGPNDDPDRDGFTNLEEFQNETNPLTPDQTQDTDNDGMWDRWETLHGLIVGIDDGAHHADSDGVSNYVEFQNGTDPQAEDTDGDGIHDGWELQYGLSPLLNDASLDPDGDGRSNLEEFQQGTDPGSAQIPHSPTDLDGDGMFDAWELANGLNPAINDSALDPDHDGLTNIQEFTIRTRPTNRDTDSDLLPDLWEHQHNLNPRSATSPDGTHDDPDSDGLTNLNELINGTHPRLTDTDGDSVSDGDEVGQGSDPNDPTDGGQPPPPEQMVDVPFTVGDPSGSYSERWQMIIQADGPGDNRRFELVSPDFGKMSPPTFFKLRRTSQYTITLKWLDTKISNGPPDYDWQAQVDEMPYTYVLPGGATHSGADRFAMIKNTWILDNQDGLLGRVNDSFSSTDYTSSKVAKLLPLEADLDVNGDGDLDDPCDGVAKYMPGYEDTTAKLHSGTTFETAQYSGPQHMNLIIENLPTGVVDQATVRMVSGSNWAGYCGNGEIPSEAPLLPYMDFSFDAHETVNENQEVTVPISGNKMIAPIHCHDYGAWCDVEITLKKNGTAINGAPIRLTLPHDGNGDRLADHWQAQQIHQWNVQYSANLDTSETQLLHTWPVLDGDKEMADPDQSGPLFAHKTQGDGLDTVKEYRGFVLDYVSGNSADHRRLSNSKKNVLLEFSELPNISTAITNGTNPTTTYDLAGVMNSVSQFFDNSFGIEINYAKDTIIAPVNIKSAAASLVLNSPAYNLGGPNYLYGDEYLESTNLLLHDANFKKFQGVYLPHGFQDSRHADYSKLHDFVRFRINSRDTVNRINSSGNYVNWKYGSSNATWDTEQGKGARIQVAAIAEEGGNFGDILAYAIAHELGHLLNSASGGHDGGTSPTALMSNSSNPTIGLGNISVTNDDAASLDIPTRRSTQ